MSIVKINTLTTGLIDVTPSFVYIDTTNTLSQVLVTGYLNQAKDSGYLFTNKQMALVNTSDYGLQLLSVIIVRENYSLESSIVPGQTYCNQPTTTPISIAVNNIYITNLPAGIQFFSLPTTSKVGDTITIIGKAPGGWRITQNAGQQILNSTSSSTIGVTGSVSSTVSRTCISLICTTANTTWTQNSLSGTLTFV